MPVPASGARALSPAAAENRFERSGSSTSHGSSGTGGRTLSLAAAESLQPTHFHENRKRSTHSSPAGALSPTAAENRFEHNGFSASLSSPGVSGRTLSLAAAGSLQHTHVHDNRKRDAHGSPAGALSQTAPGSLQRTHVRDNRKRNAHGSPAGALSQTAAESRFERSESSTSHGSSGVGGRTLSLTVAESIQLTRLHENRKRDAHNGPAGALSQTTVGGLQRTHVRNNRKRSGYGDPAGALSPAVGRNRGISVSCGDSRARALSLVVTDRCGSVGGR
jgi:hypothetical protein